MTSLCRFAEHDIAQNLTKFVALCSMSVQVCEAEEAAVWIAPAGPVLGESASAGLGLLPYVMWRYGCQPINNPPSGTICPC